MFSRKHPEVLWMPVTLYHLPAVPSAHLDQMAGRLQQYLFQTHHVTDIDGHCIAPIVHVNTMPQCVISNLQQPQQAWVVNSVYLQAGYYDERGVKGVAQSVACAMTIFDACTCLSGVSTPDGHVPLPASQDEAEEFERIVSNHYRSGIGVWSEPLVNHRNHILVRSRALVTGTDPDIAWEHFKSRGKRALSFLT
jgi:hypothetical protein